MASGDFCGRAHGPRRQRWRQGAVRQGGQGRSPGPPAPRGAQAAARASRTPVRRSEDRPECNRDAGDCGSPDSRKAGSPLGREHHRDSRPRSPEPPPAPYPRGQASTSEQIQPPPCRSQRLGAVHGKSRLSQVLHGGDHSPTRTALPGTMHGQGSRPPGWQRENPRKRAPVERKG